MGSPFFPTNTGISVRVLTKLPATLTAIGGIGVSKVNGIWTIQPTWPNLQFATTVNPSDELWIRDPNTGVYFRITLATLLTAISAVPDGNKGDITTSGGGTLWNINSHAVTYNKMQQVSAAQRLLGLGLSSAPGDVQEILLGSNLSMTANTLNATGSGGGATLIVGSGGSAVVGGVAGQILFDNAGVLGELSQPPSTLLGRGTGSAGGAQQITLGAGLSMFGTTLSATAGRQVQTANVVYYVSPTGSDTLNSGLSAISPFQTIQKAIDIINTLDGGGFAASVSIAAGTYTAPVVAAKPFIGFSSVTLTGDTTTPANVTISVNAATQNCIQVDNGAILNVQGLKLVASGSLTGTTGAGIFTQNQAIANIVGNMEFGQCALAHMFAFSGSQINVLASYTISGNGTFHMGAVAALISNRGTPITVTFTADMTFPGAFAYCDRLGLLNMFSVNYVSSPPGVHFVSGTRFSVTLNSVIFTSGAGVDFFPGSIVGATGSGGQYA